MRIHYLQHVEFEDPAYILRWAKDSGHEVSSTRLYLEEPLPAIDTIDWLLIMGGPMSVNDESRVVWLRQEKKFIERCMAANRQVMGFCLGAQLIASVLGARVYSNPHKEIGWFPVKIQPGVHPVFPSEMMAFHWHGETFDLPREATLFASSEACSHQAFHYGSKVWAFQFHPEMLRTSIENLIRFCPEDLVPGPYVQPAMDILARSKESETMNATLGIFLQYLADSEDL